VEDSPEDIPVGEDIDSLSDLVVPDSRKILSKHTNRFNSRAIGDVVGAGVGALVGHHFNKPGSKVGTILGAAAGGAGGSLTSDLISNIRRKRFYKKADREIEKLTGGEIKRVPRQKRQDLGTIKAAGLSGVLSGIGAKAFL